MTSHTNQLVKPMGLAENHFLQVLLDRFDVLPQQQGYTLSLAFDDHTPAIWNRLGRREIEMTIPEFQERSQILQKRFDSLLAGSTRETVHYSDPTFPFRWGNAGTLPIIRIEGKDYYCLFYRDITPIGWNIANGGTDSRDELKDPRQCMHRELREELISVVKASGHQHVLEIDVDDPVEHPDFALARRLWQEAKPNLRFDVWKPVRISVRWIHGPDSLFVQMGACRPVKTEGYFLNINGLDFGIEVDRVAKFCIPSNALLLDGEISAGYLVGRPIGLFDVDPFNQKVEDIDHEYIPDILFYDGERHEGSDFRAVRELFLDRIDRTRQRDAADKDLRTTSSNQFGLCPVTRGIVKRYSQLPTELVGQVEYDVFISYGATDEILAQRVYEALTAHRPQLRVFFNPEVYSQTLLGRSIDAALDNTRLLIAVGTSLRNLQREWPEYEWRTFHNDILSGRKPSAELVALVQGVDPRDLPRPLRYRRALECNEDGDIDRAIREILRIVDRLSML